MALDNDTRNIINRAFRDKDFITRVSLGLINGWSTVNKFGAGTANTTESIIRDGMEDGNPPLAIDENFGLTIVSDNAADVGQLVEIEYTEYDEITGDWNNKKGIAITNGLTPVVVNEIGDEGIIGPAKSMIPFRMTNRGTGVSNQGSLVGTVRLLRDDGEECNRMFDGDNQSLTTLFVVPSGYCFAIFGVGRSIVGINREAKFNYKVIPYGEPNQVKRATYLSTSSIYEKFEVPFVFPEKSIMNVTSKVIAGTALISAWYDGTLIDMEVL